MFESKSSAAAVVKGGLGFIVGGHGSDQGSVKTVRPYYPCDNTAQLYEKGRDLKLIIRTDAGFSTSRLKSELCKSLTSSHSAHFNFAVADVNGSVGQESYVQRIVHSAYEIWGHSMLKTMVKNLDYDAYGVDPERSHVVAVDFFNSKDVAGNAISQSQEAFDDPFFVSFDEMIRPENDSQADRWGDLGFSRLFSMDGRERYDYVGRPGKMAIEDQISVIKERLKVLSEEEGRKIPVVLLEDNVRHARMINWAIDLMRENGVLDYAEIKAVSTCFCCAPEDERAKIQSEGKSVPVLAVSDYQGEIVDVITSRDLMFDGIVVELNGKHTRLPALFMDLEQRMGIKPENQKDFVQDVVKANILFCDMIKSAFDFDPPVSWFIQPEAIERVTGLSGDMSMTDFMNFVAPNLPMHNTEVGHDVQRRLQK